MSKIVGLVVWKDAELRVIAKEHAPSPPPVRQDTDLWAAPALHLGQPLSYSGEIGGEERGVNRCNDEIKGSTAAG